MPDTPTELQCWECYVDEINETHVYLVMADTATDDDNQEIGEFPKHLLDHLEPRLGQLINVRVMSDGQVIIENTILSQESIAKGKMEIDRLLTLLSKLRDDPDGTKEKAMKSMIVFELSKAVDYEEEDVTIRKFEVVGIGPETVWDTIDDNDNGVFDFIEEIEQEVGTIDQTGSKNGEEADWTFSSCEIEDRDGFVDRMVAKIQELTGWELVERK